MYNEKLKTDFIKSHTTAVNVENVIKQLFCSTQKFEEKLGKDLCQLTTDEFRQVVDSVAGFRKITRNTQIGILKRYIEYCVSVGFPGTREDNIEVEGLGLEKMRLQTVSSPAHLNHYLNQICSPVDDNTTDIIYRCYYWLAFAGMREEDILSVKNDDVLLDDMIIRFNGKEYPIYREAMTTFKKCLTLTQFVYRHPNRRDVLMDRFDEDVLIRGIKAAPSLKTMRVELSRRSKHKREVEKTTDLKLSYYRVWISGHFYRMYEREQIGIEPDFSDLVAEHTHGKVYKLDSGKNTIQDKKRRLAKCYADDYERWKLAFKV